MQTSYSLNPAIGREGQLAESVGKQARSYLTESTVIAGKAVLSATTAPFPANVTDVDTIALSQATSGSAADATLNGSVGTAAMYPPRRITMTLSSHANFDAGTVTVTGTDVDGNAQSEDLTIPDGGNATLTTNKAFKTVTTVHLTAMGGTGGAYSVGTLSTTLHHDYARQGLPAGVVTIYPTPAVGVDVDAIIKSKAASGSADQTNTGTALDGVVGRGRMFPARQITLVLNSHANWDATTAVVTGLDAEGNVITDSLSIPDGGNTTLTTTNYYAQVTSILVPQQSGTSATYTAGIPAGMTTTITGRQILGVSMYDAAKEPASTASAGYEYATKKTIPVLRKGQIYVKTENACTPEDQVFVRVIAAGAEETGSFRSDSDSSDCVKLTGARFLMSSSTAGINVLELDL